jgi:hypothetical protein
MSDDGICTVNYHVHLADYSELRNTALQVRSQLKRLLASVEDIHHAIDHAQDKETPHELLRSVEFWLTKQVEAITAATDKELR